MRRLLLGLALASVTVFAPSAVQAGDQEIATHIEQKLREANQQGLLKDFSLDLQVSKGVVWFKGQVASQTHERLILTTAQRAKHLGVVKIIDEISVGTAQQPTQVSQKPVLKPTTQAVGTGAARSQQNARAYYNQQNGQQQVRQTANQVVAPAQPMAQPQPRLAPQPRVAQLPMPTAPTVPVGRPVMQNSMPVAGGQANLRAPNYMPVSERRAAAQYDHPQMPNYAWPAYAAHPNYGAVTYPKQYSPSAWPYIGPFYPYPQVPLGWRKVTMEWDDGWWYLDFQDH